MGHRPSYVDNLIEIKQRAVISKIRTSSHSPMIEKGRHASIPASERLCKVCNSRKIEDEEHFLLHCNNYEPERQLFINKIITSNPGFGKFSPVTKIIFILNNKSPNILRMSSTFIMSCFNKRDISLQ